MKKNPTRKHKIIDHWDHALQLVSQQKSKHHTIVFTNGCFDVLHAGHIYLLNQAAELGDFLIIGLNSDESVTTLKGPSRPFNGEKDRSIVLAALEMVDAVVLFPQETPLELIIKLKPDVLVKGGDWKVEHIVGAKEVLAYGGIVKSLDLLDGYSSTAVIEKLNDEN